VVLGRELKLPPKLIPIQQKSQTVK